MMIIISYDVNTEDDNGKCRLRKIVKICKNHAQRVQNSVFEANLDYSSFLLLKEQPVDNINPNTDSLRFYYLGNKWKNKIEHIGSKEGYDSEGILIV